MLSHMTFKQIKKGSLSVLLITSFGMYVFLNRSRAALGTPPLPPIQNGGKQNIPSTLRTDSGIPNPITAINRYFNEEGDDEEGAVSAVAKPSVTTKPSSLPVSVTPGTYKNGTWNGTASYAYTGTIQVSLTIASGKITDVQAIDASRSGTSKQINANALPMLKSETIQAQGDVIDAVSGATYTSAAYLESLKSALSQAKPI